MHHINDAYNVAFSDDGDVITYLALMMGKD